MYILKIALIILGIVLWVGGAFYGYHRLRRQAGESYSTAYSKAESESDRESIAHAYAFMALFGFVFLIIDAIKLSIEKLQHSHNMRVRRRLDRANPHWVELSEVLHSLNDLQALPSKARESEEVQQQIHSLQIKVNELREAPARFQQVTAIARSSSALKMANQAVQDDAAVRHAEEKALTELSD